MTLQSTEQQHCYLPPDQTDIGAYIKSGTFTLPYQGGTLWQISPSPMLCSGNNGLTDDANCNTGNFKLRLFAGGLDEVDLLLSQADSYTCSPFSATWESSLSILAAHAYGDGLRSVVISE